MRSGKTSKTSRRKQGIINSRLPVHAGEVFVLPERYGDIVVMSVEQRGSWWSCAVVVGDQNHPFGGPSIPVDTRELRCCERLSIDQAKRLQRRARRIDLMDKVAA